MGRIEFDTSDTALYCDTSDVARWFEQYDDFDASTDPSAADVKEHIFEWMEYIDRQTGHAWRPNTVHEENKDLGEVYYWWSGVPVELDKRDVREFDSAQGDKIEIWDGSNWDDWVADATKTYGRDGDYWLDKSAGILYIRDRFFIEKHPHIRVTYRYGDPTGATRAIRMACSKFVAADLVSSDQYSMNIPGTEGAMDEQAMVEQWKSDAEDVIDERKEVEYVEPY